MGTEAAPARRLALSMLVRSRDREAQGMERTLEEARQRGDISGVDASLAQEIALGVSRQRRWLEHLLHRYLHHPMPRQADKVQEALLTGIYQAVFLDRIPAHTVVDETVKLVAAARTETGYRGLANAIMRKVVAEPKGSLLPTDSDPWTLRYSVPDWLASEAGQVYRDDELRAFFAASNEPAPLALRIVQRPGAIEAEALMERLRGEIVDATHAVPDVAQGRHLADCIIVRGRGVVPAQLPSFRQGLVTAEDEGAQIAACFAGARRESRILDLCAAPGGKTAHLADLAERAPGLLVASDLEEAKLVRLRDTMQRLGLEGIVRTELADRLSPADFPGLFDIVLVDAPCSALGTLRRHPEARWRHQAANIRALAKNQLRILDRAREFVAPGGTLLYSVCTFTRPETDAVADRFLELHPEFAPAAAPEGLPFDDAPLRTAPGRWRTATHRDGCDTFFIARFRRGE